MSEPESLYSRETRENKDGHKFIVEVHMEEPGTLYSPYYYKVLTTDHELVCVGPSVRYTREVVNHQGYTQGYFHDFR